MWWYQGTSNNSQSRRCCKNVLTWVSVYSVLREEGEQSTVPSQFLTRTGSETKESLGDSLAHTLYWSRSWNVQGLDSSSRLGISISGPWLKPESWSRPNSNGGRNGPKLPIEKNKEKTLDQLWIINTGSIPQGSLIVSNRSLPFKYGYWQSWDGPRSTRYSRIAGSPTRSAGALIREWKWSRRGEARWVSRTIGSEYPKGRDRNQRKVQKGLNNLGTPNQLRKEEILWQRQKVGHLGFDKNTKTIS